MSYSILNHRFRITAQDDTPLEGAFTFPPAAVPPLSPPQPLWWWWSVHGFFHVCNDQVSITQSADQSQKALVSTTFSVAKIMATNETWSWVLCRVPFWGQPPTLILYIYGVLKRIIWFLKAIISNRHRSIRSILKFSINYYIQNLKCSQALKVSASRHFWCRPVWGWTALTHWCRAAPRTGRSAALMRLCR